MPWLEERGCLGSVVGHLWKVCPRSKVTFRQKSLPLREGSKERDGQKKQREQEGLRMGREVPRRGPEWACTGLQVGGWGDKATWNGLGGGDRMRTECKYSSGPDWAYCGSASPGATQIRKRHNPDPQEVKRPVRGTYLQAVRTQCRKRRQ